MSKRLLRGVTFTTRLTGVAGPAAFQRRMAMELERRGIPIGWRLEDEPQGAILVIGGSRHLTGLRQARRRGRRIIQRLNGINWLHRRHPTGIRHFLRAERNNLLLRWVRNRLADHVVYQSQFAKDWWEERYGPAPVPSSVVYNGVPLDVYSPEGDEARPDDRIRLLMVEGNYAGGYEIGLQAGIELAQRVAREAGRKVELTVAGQVPGRVHQAIDPESELIVDWRGVVEPADIPALDRTAHVLFAGDIHPACPNAVIEAMACGLPVVAYDTGALPELVTGPSGRVTAYGGDAWKLETPDVVRLVEATREILEEQPRYRAGARARAEETFGLDRMVDEYLAALHGK
ncbi:MAG: glycosyltransferase family 4 protein [Chloroflexi bacterium]|nr:glycosyltransferase family 4 protein [Chloroflexota bacterium]